MENTSLEMLSRRLPERNWRKACVLLNLCLLLGTTPNLAMAANVPTPTVKVSVQTVNSTLKSVLNDLEKQSGYYFVHSDDVNINQPVSLDVRGIKLKQALEVICKDRGLVYEFSGKYITLKKAPREVKAVAQSEKKKVVKGRIIDKDGEPIIGATIQVKGGTTGAIADVEGNFSLEVEEDATLVVSYIGMKTEEITARGRQMLSIVLQEDAVLMNEVVVVGYGTQKKVNLTGAIATVGTEQLVQAHRPNLSSALAGNLPGIRSVQKSGRPGEDGATDLDIRGFGSALVIVDGVESDYKSIDPNDIESINVLKDASAAVYGFKGANGVILVTTKKGKEGKAKVNYSFNMALQSATRMVEVMDAVEYMTYMNESNANRGLSEAFSSDVIQEVANGTSNQYFNTDWNDLVMRKNAPMQTHNINVSGGSGKFRYFTSFGYLHQDGIVRTNDTYERLNVRSNLSMDIIENLTADLNLSARRENRHSPVAIGTGGAFDDKFSSGVFTNMRTALPYYEPYANGNRKYYNSVQDGVINPLVALDEDVVGAKISHAEQFAGQFQLKYDFSKWVKGLSARAVVNYERNSTLAKENPKAFSTYSYDAVNDTYVEKEQSSTNKINRYHDTNSWLTQQYTLNYNNNFGKHDISALAVWETKKYDREYFKAEGELDNTLIPELDASNSNNRMISGSSEEKAWAGLVARINYAYDAKYLIELSGRYDGSYKFAKDKRWNFFPAVSVGWRLSEENFIKNSTDIFDNIKLRASFGVIGDEVDANPGNYLEGYTYPSGNRYVFGPGNVISGAKDKGLINPNFTWYESRLTNVGIDVSMWKGKLGLEFDVFYRKRTGLKATLGSTLPTSFGANLPEQNLNSDSHRGFELVLSHKNTINDFHYEVRGNLTYTRKKNLYKEQAPFKNAYDNWRHNGAERWENIGWGYKAVGQFGSWEEVLSSPVQDNNGNLSLMPGDIKFEDYNRDGIINELDEQPITRNGTPEMFFGLNMLASYKGFDFSMLWQGASNYTFTILHKEPYQQSGRGNGYRMYEDRWHRTDMNDMNSQWIPGRFPAIRAESNPASNGKASTFWSPNIYYLRLKNIELGYTLPKSWVNRCGVQNLRFYVGGYNLLTFAPSSVDGMDPEGNALYGMYYPQTRTVNFGFNLEF